MEKSRKSLGRSSQRLRQIKSRAKADQMKRQLALLWRSLEKAWADQVKDWGRSNQELRQIKWRYYGWGLKFWLHPVWPFTMFKHMRGGVCPWPPCVETLYAPVGFIRGGVNIFPVWASTGPANIKLEPETVWLRQVQVQLDIRLGAALEKSRKSLGRSSQRLRQNKSRSKKKRDRKFKDEGDYYYSQQ